MSFDKVQQVRSDIDNCFNGSEACQEYFYDDDHEELYSGYYTAMYLINDTAVSIDSHRDKDFQDGSYLSYIEFWGVMQAIFIQQDSISELYLVVSGSALSSKNLSAWQELRDLRNSTAGHPSKKDRPKDKPTSRAFMGRSFGTYEAIKFERWESPDKITHPVVNLGEVIDSYAEEAAGVMKDILSIVQSKW